MRRRRIWGRLLLTAGAFFLQGAAHGAAASFSIEEAVERALAFNTSLRIEAQGERTAAAALKNARGASSFDVSLSGSLTDGRSKGETRRDNGALTLRAGLPLYTGGRSEAEIKSAELGVDAARLHTERARENIRLAVIEAYYNVLQAKKTVAIDQETVDKYQAHLTNVEHLFTAGSKARLDVLRSSVELTNARQTLIRAENDHKVKVLTLKNLLRLEAEEELVLTEDFGFVPFHPGMEACVSYAYRSRKDLLIDEYALAQRELDVKAAKAGYLPTLSLSASAGASDRLYPSSDARRDYQLGLSASWTLFDSGVTASAVDRAETARDTAALTLERDREEVGLEVRRSYYNMREAERRLAATKAAVSEAEEDYYIASEKYRAGQGILLDVIDAQEALATARLNFNSAQYDYARYKAAVENAMGLARGLDPGVADPERTAAREARIKARGGMPDGPREPKEMRRARALVDAGTPARAGAAKETDAGKEG